MGSMKTDYLTAEQFDQMFELMSYKNALALRVSLQTGLRIDDVLSLRPQDLQGRTLRGTAEKTGKKFVKQIGSDLARELKKIGSNYFIFQHRLDPKRHRTRQAVWADVKKAAKLLKFDVNAAPHSARKNYGVEVFRKSGLSAARRALQHDSDATTMIYALSDKIVRNNKKTAQIVDLSDETIEKIADMVAKKIAETLDSLG